MAKLHEVLAAEKTTVSAWNQLYEDTLKKFKSPSHFFEGHTKSLAMIEDTAENKAIEAAAREEKALPTTVFDTLDYALGIFKTAEDLQFQKNKTNQGAVGTVNWQGQPLLIDLPVDQLLGLEARLTRIRELFVAIPTVDATKEWKPAADEGKNVMVAVHPEETTKTEKQIVPVTLKEATREHPAQVQAIGKDIVVGKFTTVRRTGAATAIQKSDAIKRLDELLVEVKQARMRANETTVVQGSIADKITGLILEPLKG